jgi:SPP1 family predicted phage head-tail adaptor
MAMHVLDPGQFSARLIREASVDVPDGQGGVSRSFDALDRLWARIEPVTATVAPHEAGERAVVTHRLWTGWRTDIEAGQRLRLGARVFLIRLVRDPDETRRFLVCDCEEGGQ